MNNWWESKKERTRRRKRQNQQERYMFWDIVLDILFWIPELVFLPFRILFWILRGFVRWISDFI